MPEGARVSKMFGQIAGRYDCANRVLSLGIDCYWRHKLVSMVKAHNPRWVVDLATGSGDVAFALKKALGEGTQVVGLDFCRSMLKVAESKKVKKGYAEGIDFRFGDCMALPLETASVDALTIAFGLRNLEDRSRGLREMARVLRPGGRLFILEFSQPTRCLRHLYYFYLRSVLPRIAKVVAGDREAYEYLAKSIEQFPEKEALGEEMGNAGFKEVHSMALTAGVVAIHSGVV